RCSCRFAVAAVIGAKARRLELARTAQVRDRIVQQQVGRESIFDPCRAGVRGNEPAAAEGRVRKRRLCAHRADEEEYAQYEDRTTSHGSLRLEVWCTRSTGMRGARSNERLGSARNRPDRGAA